MALNTNNSVLAILEESTEGTPVAPSAGTDFVALQEGFSFEPTFNILENNEIRSSIGTAKGLTGLESPSISFSHYVRHSGVEGTAPGYKKLLKAALGAENVNSTQRLTTAASTTSLIKLASGGTDFARGRAILLKDGTNGYSIRPVDSVATNDLTLGFNVSVAPATGLGCGKAITYSPVSTGHPSLTLWDYRGNQGAVEAVSGARVTEMSVDISAGELINAQYSLEGVKYYFDPITIASADTKLDFLDNATTRAATVTAKTYRDPHELAQALQDSMNSLGSANTFAVTYNDTGASAGKFTLTSTGATFNLLWSTGANTANTIGDKIGFVVSADDTGSLTYTSDNAQSWVAAYTPSYDNTDPLVAKSMEILLGDSTYTTNLSSASVSIRLADAKSNVLDVTAESGVSGSVIQKREVTVDIVAYLNQHDADKFRRFRANSDTKFLCNAGVKSGGNWVAGKCVSFYIPSCTVSSFTMGDSSGIVTLEMSLQAFVDSSGNNEFYINFV